MASLTEALVSPVAMGEALVTPSDPVELSRTASLNEASSDTSLSAKAKRCVVTSKPIASLIWLVISWGLNLTLVLTFRTSVGSNIFDDSLGYVFFACFLFECFHVLLALSRAVLKPKDKWAFPQMVQAFFVFPIAALHGVLKMVIAFKMDASGRYLILQPEPPSFFFRTVMTLYLGFVMPWAFLGEHSPIFVIFVIPYTWLGVTIAMVAGWMDQYGRSHSGRECGQSFTKDSNSTLLSSDAAEEVFFSVLGIMFFGNVISVGIGLDLFRRCRWTFIKSLSVTLLISAFLGYFLMFPFSAIFAHLSANFADPKLMFEAESSICSAFFWFLVLGATVSSIPVLLFTIGAIAAAFAVVAGIIGLTGLAGFWGIVMPLISFVKFAITYEDANMN